MIANKLFSPITQRFGLSDRLLLGVYFDSGLADTNIKKESAILINEFGNRDNPAMILRTIRGLTMQLSAEMHVSRMVYETADPETEEVFESENDTAILRLLNCINDHYQSLANRAVAGMAPWRSGHSVTEPEDPESETGPVYLGELENMLNTLVNNSRNEEIVKAAKNVLERLAEDFS